MTSAWSGYLADPFVTRTPHGYVAYGSGPPARQTPPGPRVFECLVSPDLRTWRSVGPVLYRLPPEYGDEYWAPEVAEIDGAWWMYYSVGHGIDGHHVRVARADDPTGPFHDTGVNLTREESFAIDAHPFCDLDGSRYLFFARDVLDDERPGTHLAVARLEDPLRVGAAVAALRPTHDWQIYERQRAMYGRVLDWHTLEGPFVVLRHGTYWMTYSGGAWTGDGYAVSWARAEHPLGPWEPCPPGTPPLLHTRGDLLGPGHNSITSDDVGDVIAFHAWDRTRQRRQMHLRRLDWRPDGPSLGPALAS